jgi:hypothetical protein
LNVGAQRAQVIGGGVARKIEAGRPEHETHLVGLEALNRICDLLWASEIVRAQLERWRNRAPQLLCADLERI